MSPRTGRPKIENPKNHDIKVRIDEATNRALMEYSEKHGISRTEVIRQGIELILRQDEK